MWDPVSYDPVYGPRYITHLVFHIKFRLFPKAGTMRLISLKHETLQRHIVGIERPPQKVPQKVITADGNH